jgi:hypothetical protein
VLEQAIIGRHKHGCNIDQKLPKLDAVAALVRRAHEDNPVRRHLDEALFFQCTRARSIGVDKSL